MAVNITCHFRIRCWWTIVMAWVDEKIQSMYFLLTYNIRVRVRVQIVQIAYV